ncbi:MAG TPA: AlpA family phage regulatory protein [Thermoanaerobaculia bacterium]|nr:AlpA family phage regulatory protein [Thermoanaerobaculia bacterium]
MSHWQPPERPLRHPEVLQLVGVKRDTLWRWRAEGLFPRGFRINRRGDLAWSPREIEDWLNRRAAGEVGL